MIISSSIIQYNTSDIKRALDTKITEFSNDGYYDYLPLPSYTFELPADGGPFWKRDNIVIKWDYSEPLNDLIPLSNIYLISGSSEKLIKKDVETRVKNINWVLPFWLSENVPYHFKISTMFEGEEIHDTSSIFTVEDRYINITTGAPIVPIVANDGRTFTIDWNAYGASDYVKIELLQALEVNTITYEGTVGRLIGNPAGNQQTAQQNIPAANGDPQNPVVIKVLEQKKHVGSNTSYVWNVEDIPYDVDNVRLKIIDSYHQFVYDYTPPIELKVPYIGIKNFVGRRMGPEIITGVTYSGTSDALLSVYGFEPANMMVEEGSSLKFEYATTNAVRVYLTRAGKPNYSRTLPLAGTFTITDIKDEDIYTVNAVDIHEKIRKATFEVRLELEQTINGTDISEFSLLQLLNYSIGLGQEALTSGDAIVEPGAQIIAKIPQYKTEADQMNESTDYETVKFLLSLVNEDIIVVLLNGQEEPPRVLLGSGDLRDRIGEANIEISKRLQGVPVAGITVSGFITSQSLGIPGVSIHFNNGGGNTETDNDGYYIKQLPALYSGVATPHHSNYTFTPVDKTYTNLDNSLINQNYEGMYGEPIPQLRITTTQRDLPTLFFKGENYSIQLEAEGGKIPYTWSVSSNLPAELSLTPEGTIYGIILNSTPATTYTRTFKVTDGYGVEATKELNIKVTDA